jgi:Tfp pilus assembly protein FimT
MFIKAKKKIKIRPGMSLMEMGLVMGVIAIIAMGLAAVGSGYFSSAEITNATKSIDNLYSASMSCWYTRANTSFADISVQALIDNKCLPAGFEGEKSNPWGGGFEVAPNPSDNSRVQITVTQVPVDEGQSLEKSYKKKADASYSSSSKTLVVSF